MDASASLGRLQQAHSTRVDHALFEAALQQLAYLRHEKLNPAQLGRGPVWKANAVK